MQCHSHHWIHAEISPDMTVLQHWCPAWNQAVFVPPPVLATTRLLHTVDQMTASMCWTSSLLPCLVHCPHQSWNQRPGAACTVFRFPFQHTATLYASHKRHRHIIHLDAMCSRAWRALCAVGSLRKNSHIPVIQKRHQIAACKTLRETGTGTI